MELWDIYDAQRRPTGRTHARGAPMRRGEYHINVFVWIFNSAGELLLTKRSPEKESYPNLWETTGGAVLAGETSRQAIVRELREETGLCAAPEEFVFLDSVRGKTWFSDTYALRRDAPLSQIVLQPGETCDARWVTRAAFERMIAAGEVAQPDVQRFYTLAYFFNELLK